MKARKPVADHYHPIALEPRRSDIPLTPASGDFARNRRRESTLGVKFDPEKSGAGGLVRSPVLPGSVSARQSPRDPPACDRHPWRARGTPLSG